MPALVTARTKTKTHETQQNKHVLINSFFPYGTCLFSIMFPLYNGWLAGWLVEGWRGEAATVRLRAHTHARTHSLPVTCALEVL